MNDGLANTSLNRQARHHNGEWIGFGPVTHQRAAETYARRTGICEYGPAIIQTREEGSDVVFMHRVSRKPIEYRVDCLRGDDNV